MGLGLSAFLSHDEDTVRKFMKDWKKKGNVTVWLHVGSGEIAWPSYCHPFQMYGTFKNQEGKEIETLRYMRFVSPDPDVVHKNQYFRNPDDSLQILPVFDPFLLLREWLRREVDSGRIASNTVVFKWTHPNPQPGKIAVIEWQAGHLSRLTDRTQATFGSSLDTRLEYYFVVVDHDATSEGLQIVRGTKLLGSKMKEAISQQMKSDGDMGNPLLHPYAFRWEFDATARSPMDSYKAYRFNQAKLSPQINELIYSASYPDPTRDCKPRQGDKSTIRLAFEQAAQIPLPYDILFRSEWQDEAPEDFNFGDNAVNGSNSPAMGSKVSGTTGMVSEAVDHSRADYVDFRGIPHVAAVSPDVQRSRRRRKSPPKVPMVPCDNCKKMMPETAQKCQHCGEEYIIENDTQTEVSTRVDKYKTTNTTPENVDKDPTPTESPICWSCGSNNIVGNRCNSCGLDIEDDLPVY